MTQDKPDVLLSVDQAADLLLVSRSTAYRMVRAGAIESVKQEAHTGQRTITRVPRSAVCRYMTALKAKAQGWIK